MVSRMKSAGAQGADAIMERLWSAYTTLGRGIESTNRVFWLVGSEDLDGATLMDAFQRKIEDIRAPYLATDCERPFPLAFEPIKDLLRQLVPVVERDVPRLLIEYSAELLALLPELG